MIELPASLEWMVESPKARGWIGAAVDAFVEQLERWSLTLDGPAFDGGYASLVAPVRTAAGEPAVLKLQFPHRECRHEARALQQWDGRGAIRLLDHDPDRHALLVERCTPGTSLEGMDSDLALDIVIPIFDRLLAPAADLPIDRLEDEALGWVDEMHATYERLGRPIDPGLIVRVSNLARELASSQGEQVLLHQDLHAGNVLRAEREPWLVIDPKPLVGERELAVVALVRGEELGLSRELMRRRLDRFSADLDLDRDRVRDWAAVQTLAWGLDSGAWERDVQTVGWLLEM